MTSNPLRLQQVTALPGQKLHLVFADGWSAEVDLSGWIAETRALQPLADPVLFAQPRLSEWGTGVEWIPDTLDLGADNLRHLAVEQAGGIGHERLCHWMHACGLTQQQAADAVGISRRMLNYYLSAARPIPKTVWLACVGWQAEQAQHRAQARTARRRGTTAHSTSAPLHA